MNAGITAERNRVLHSATARSGAFDGWLMASSDRSGVAAFGEQLRRYRLSERLTQAALAEKAGLSERAVSDLERGLKLPQRATIQLLIEALDLSAERATEFERLARTRSPSAAAAWSEPDKHNLPAALTTFVGRSEEISRLLKLLSPAASNARPGRLVTLSGSGGIGKTRLAVEISRGLADEYADGVRMVELAALKNPRLVVQTVADVLKVRERPGRAVDDAVVDSLRQQQLLLVLDNCEHLIQACAEFAEMVLRACPALRILATSREPLRVEGETIWRVGSLSLPGSLGGVPIDETLRSEAGRLFIDRVQAALPDFTLTERAARAIRTICVQLDGIPLALELAAARARQMDVEQIAARLNDRFRLLVDGSRAAPARQQTLRATVDWSYELLSTFERQLFERLAVFAGSWTLDSAEAVCGGDGLDPADLLDLHGQLVDKSLVLMDRTRVDGPLRYHMLETVREYAHERLAASAMATGAAHRHVDYFVALAEQAEPELRRADQQEWLERLELDHDNMRSALHWSMRHRPDQAMRLGAALWYFWYVHGHFTEGRGCLEECLNLQDAPATANRERSIRARVLNGAGGLASIQGDSAASRSFHRQALAIRRELGDLRGVAGSLNNLGGEALAQGELELARSLLEESLAIMRQVDEPWGAGLALLNLGVTARLQCDFARAQSLLEESLAIMRRLGDRWGMALSLNIQGEVAHECGKLALARSLYQESLTMLRDVGDRRRVGLVLKNRGNLERLDGDYHLARRLYRESLAIAHYLGDSYGILNSLEGFAALAAAVGQTRHAVQLAGAANALRESIGAPLLDFQREQLQVELAPAEQALGEKTRARLWREGRAMNEEQAVALALGMP